MDPPARNNIARNWSESSYLIPGEDWLYFVTDAKTGEVPDQRGLAYVERGSWR